MSVRAKVKCIEVHHHEGGRRVKLAAVNASSDHPENASWSKYTPSGQIDLSITNPVAFNQFEVGKSYWVDFNIVE